MSFTSKQSVMMSDGKFIVTGDLSLTRIERSVTAEPNEAYSGPDYLLDGFDHRQKQRRHRIIRRLLYVAG